MSYDLAVWEGDRPRDDVEAGEVFGRLMDQMESDEPRPPSPRIRAYVEALLQRWPDIDTHDGSPWAASPLMGDASGSMVYVAMTYSGAQLAVPYAAELARAHGLVCFDPQAETLL